MKETLYLQRSENGRLIFGPAPKKSKSGHTLSGNIQEHLFESSLLNASIKVWVYLPPWFSPADPWRYPTLYLHDGQNVFDRCSAAFGVEWEADESAEELNATEQMEPTIMIAVANTPERLNHYTPFYDYNLGGGQGELYAEFMTKEIKPWIDSIYPTKQGPAFTGIAGSSLGGLSALHLGWTRPQVFGLVAALSPSLWWGARKLITRFGGDDPKLIKPSKIWIDMGTQESLDDDNNNQISDGIDDLRTMRAVLLAQGYKLGEDLFYREIQGGQHDEAAWAARFPDVLKALYPKQERARLNP
jgi:predicted alpha/beta superfamily hydrolase